MKKAMFSLLLLSLAAFTTPDAKTASKSRIVSNSQVKIQPFQDFFRSFRKTWDATITSSNLFVENQSDQYYWITADVITSEELHANYAIGFSVYMNWYGWHSYSQPVRGIWGYYGWGWGWRQFDQSIGECYCGTEQSWNLVTINPGEQVSDPLQWQLLYFYPM